MRTPVVVAAVGVVLVLTGTILAPTAFPLDRDYEYHVLPAAESYAPTEGNYTVVPYEDLSRAEKRVFDASVANDSTVRLENEVNGTTITHHTDAPSFGHGYTAVSRDGRTYVVSGTMVWENLDIHQFGGPFLALVGIICTGFSALALVLGRISRLRE